MISYKYYVVQRKGYWYCEEDIHLFGIRVWKRAIQNHKKHYSKQTAIDNINQYILQGVSNTVRECVVTLPD